MKRRAIKWADHALVPGENGWSPWQWPKHNDYRMACCDCGLVHRIDFRVDARGKPLPTADGGQVRRRHGHVMMRVARDNRSTASHRRHKEPTLGKTFLHHAADSLIALYAEHPELLDVFLRNFRASVRQKMGLI